MPLTPSVKVAALVQAELLGGLNVPPEGVMLHVQEILGMPPVTVGVTVKTARGLPEDTGGCKSTATGSTTVTLHVAVWEGLELATVTVRAPLEAYAPLQEAPAIGPLLLLPDVVQDLDAAPPVAVTVAVVPTTTICVAGEQARVETTVIVQDADWLGVTVVTVAVAVPPDG